MKATEPENRERSCSRKKIVGVFGGSFDPPHIGHVLVAVTALSVFEIDEIWVSPAISHPFGKKLSRYGHRLRMCELAFKDLDNDRVIVKDIEARIDAKGPVCAHDVALFLSRIYPEHDFRLIIGSDILKELDRWHRWEDVKVIMPPLVVTRDGEQGRGFAIPNYSSTDIRDRLKKSNWAITCKGLTPNAVIDYIKENPNLYANLNPRP